MIYRSGYGGGGGYVGIVYVEVDGRFIFRRIGWVVEINIVNCGKRFVKLGLGSRGENCGRVCYVFRFIEINL